MRCFLRLSTRVPSFQVSSGWLSMMYSTSSLYCMSDLSTESLRWSQAMPPSMHVISESGSPLSLLTRSRAVAFLSAMNLLLLITSPSMDAKEVMTTFFTETSGLILTLSKKPLSLRIEALLRMKTVSRPVSLKP